jgi:hypothetical protein
MNSEDAPKSLEQESGNQKQTSQRKIEANRRNALRSTGPKTSHGKNVVSGNAIKHGLLAREVVNTTLSEKPEDFQRLFAKLIEDCEPVGQMEWMLVEQIAVAWWRRRRVLRAENNASIKGVLTVDKNFRAAGNRGYTDLANWAVAMQEREASPLPSLLVLDRVAADEESIRRLRQTTQGIQFLLESLAEIKTEVESTGVLKELHCNWIARCFGAEGLDLLRKADKQLEPDDLQELLAAMSWHLKELAKLGRRIAAADRAEIGADLLLCSLPPDEYADRLLRYDAHYERQFYRAINELERLQRRRKGEAVPPPLKLEIDS